MRSELRVISPINQPRLLQDTGPLTPKRHNYSEIPGFFTNNREREVNNDILSTPAQTQESPKKRMSVQKLNQSTLKRGKSIRSRNLKRTIVANDDPIL